MSSRRPWLLVEAGVVSAGGVVELDADEAHHVLSVLRGQPGAEVALVDGQGTVAEGVVHSVERGRIEVEVRRVEVRPRPATPSVTLALAVLHGKAMDWAVQKAVEVGVGRLVPVVSVRSQLAPAAALGRLGHWQRLARQAIKQCRRAWAMELAEPVEFASFLEQEPAGVVADPHGVGLEEVPLEFRQTLLVGPEGGFDPNEVGWLDERGWVPLCLGRHTLRADTAAVVGAAMLVLAAEGLREPGSCVCP